MNWDDAAERLALIERVGPDEYNRLQASHLEESTVAKVNGYSIVPVGTRFGRLFSVRGTNMAFSTLKEASDYAAKQAPRKVL